MKEKEILKGIRYYLDNDMKKNGFTFNSKWETYIRADTQNQLYFEVSFLFLDFVPIGTNSKSKYLEIYLNIYHTETSKLLLEITTRGKNLDSFFYFSIIGNMLADIVLNPELCNYANRNNHNYFKLDFVTEDDIKMRSGEILSLMNKYVLPFFNRFDTLGKIKDALDCCYSNDIVIHTGNNERLLALAGLLYSFNDPLRENKIQQIRDYFISIYYEEALLELESLVEVLKSRGK